MEISSTEEIWRRIPPEEKVHLINKSHSSGIMTALAGIILAATLSISIQSLWLFWASLILAPLVFQVSAGKAWSNLRPVIILEYLAARTASRRYAYIIKSQELTHVMVFRGTVEHLDVSEEDDTSTDLYSPDLRKKVADVWINLFPDSIVVISEKKGGAELQFGHLINDRFSMTSNTDELDSDYSSDKALILEYRDRYHGVRRIRLSSRCPAALAVFEKKILKIIDAYKLANSLLQGIDGAPLDEEGDLEDMDALE